VAWPPAVEEERREPFDARAALAPEADDAIGIVREIRARRGRASEDREAGEPSAGEGAQQHELRIAAPSSTRPAAAPKRSPCGKAGFRRGFASRDGYLDERSGDRRERLGQGRYFTPRAERGMDAPLARAGRAHRPCPVGAPSRSIFRRAPLRRSGETLPF